MFKEKLLKKYPSKAKLQNFKRVLNNRASQYGVIGNKFSYAYISIAKSIDDILYNDIDFIECDVCGKEYSKVDVIEDYEKDYNVCNKCINEYYVYCEECSENLHCDDITTINNMYVCENCYFDIREHNIEKHKIINPLLKKLEKYFNGNIHKENMEQVVFKIDNYSFSIEPVSSYIRLGSFSANVWVDICNNEKNIIKAIQYLIDKNNKNIEQIYVIEDNDSICYL